MKIYKKALLLAYVTVTYNILEGIFSILFGSSADSIALIGFGFDSIIETLSGFVMIWRFSGRNAKNKQTDEKIEERAEKMVGITFFILAAYVLFESVSKIITREQPDPSLPGIIIALLSLIIMPVLYSAKMKVGNEIKSRSLIADAKETLACIYLSAALIAGLALNYFLNFWWADPAAGIIIVYFLVNEGREALSEEGCGCTEDKE